MSNIIQYRYLCNICYFCKEAKRLHFFQQLTGRVGVFILYFSFHVKITVIVFDTKKTTESQSKSHCWSNWEDDDMNQSVKPSV